MEEIKLQGVSKSFGNLKALEDVSLEIRPGELHCFGGPNGSGKTTLFRIILQQTFPSGGEVEIPEADFGCSHQRPKFYDNISVKENLDVFSSMNEVGENWRDKVFDLFSLEEIEGKESSSLSGGNSKKLGLTLSLLKKPEWILLDEPFAGLDKRSKQRFLEFLREEREHLGGVLIFSHDLDPILGLADRLTILHEGKIAFDKSQNEIEQGSEFDSLEGAYESVISDLEI